MSPLPYRCTLPAHEEATLPLSLSPLLWPSPLPLPSPSPFLLPTLSPPPLPLPIAVAVSHCRCGRRQPLLLPSLLHCRQPLPLPLPLPLPSLSAIAVFITIRHRSCHLRWPLPSPSPSAISESCCLGVARIVFNQSKQRMLTLFYFVWTVGGALIKAG